MTLEEIAKKMCTRGKGILAADESTGTAKAYAYGLDVRLNGEFIKGTESWFSFGYLNTKRI